MFGYKYKLSEDARDATCNAPWWGNTDAMGKYLRGLYCQYPHNTTTWNRDCWLGKLRRETAQCWWRRRLESGECLMITFLGAAHQMTRWIPPERCDHFCFYTEASSPTFSWVAEQDHLPHDNLTVSITLWISLIRKVLEDKKSHNFQVFFTPMPPSVCSVLILRGWHLWLWGSACWWTIQRMMAKWRLLFRFQEQRHWPRISAGHTMRK